MRFEFDHIGAFRANTLAMKPGPASTFLCCRCKQGKSITGRKKVGQDGNRKFYACMACSKNDQG